MNERATADSSELTFLRKRVAELEAKATDLCRDNEHLLKVSQRLTKSGGWQWDVGKETMTWTEESYRIHDIDPGQLVQGSPEHITLSKACYTPEDQQKIMAAFQRCVELGEPYDLEFSFTTHKGRKLWIRTTAEAVWKEGRVARAIGNILDITERKLVELKLRENEKALKAILNASPETISLIDANGTILMANKTMASRLQRTVEELIGQNAYDFFPPKIAQQRKKSARQVAETGRPVVFVDDRDGRAIESHLWPVFDETGSVARIAVFALDITERKLAEDSLKKREGQFQTLASLAPVGIYLTSPEGQCQYANPRWCEMAGLTHAEALGTGWIAGLHPDDREMVYSNWQKMVESEGQWGFEYRFQTPAGKTTWVFGLAAPQRDDSGRIVQYVGVNADITERKLAMERLTDALQEKEVLLREVHHRVKNNMAAIIGLFNLQRQAMDDPQAQTVMADLSSRVKAMSLVHEKLYRSNSLARIDFQDYLQSLISHLRTSFGSPSIRCEINAFGVEMPLDLAVPCGMIINELIINALKYAFPKERSETVKKDDVILVSMNRENDTFSLSVADNGVGLPQGFDLKTVKSLGLVLVRMLGQHQLGGRYEVDQTDGTRVTLTFSIRKPSPMNNLVISRPETA